MDGIVRRIAERLEMLGSGSGRGGESRRPTVRWPPSGAPSTRLMVCPNCGAIAGKRPVLTVRYAKPKRAMQDSPLVRCAGCGCAFFEDQNPPDYGGNTRRQRGIVPFYIQQGAGIGSLARPLVRSRRGEGTRYFDVGCGFGFALDFAERKLRWRARGIDPSMIAQFGSEMLGITIERRYLGENEPAYQGAFDMVMASEVIEHVPSPAAFLRTLRRLLVPGGLLILTTPDADDIVPATAGGALIALLSPGFHLILQSRKSLGRLLREAGFPSVVFDKDGHAMIAYASDRPFELAHDEAAFRTAYLDYLVHRADDFPPAHDLFLGFAGRAFQEAVHGGAMDVADRCLPSLRDACRARFGMDLETMTALPAEAKDCTLDQLAQIMPLSLGALLYADAMRRMAAGELRSRVEPRLLCAADAADALRKAAARWNMEDALSEEIGWFARAEAALSAVEDGDPEMLARFQALPPAPGGDRRYQSMCGRALVTLVNAGRYEDATSFAEATGLLRAPWTDPPPGSEAEPLSEAERNTLFCLAVLEMRDPDLDVCARALWRFHVVRLQIAARAQQPSGRDLYWSAVRGQIQALCRLGFADRVAELLTDAEREAGPAPHDVSEGAKTAGGDPVQDHLVASVNAGHYDVARRLVRFVGADGSDEATTARLRDRLFSLAVLDTQPHGNLARAADGFAAVRKSLLKCGASAAGMRDLYAAALRGEIEARATSEGDVSAERARQQGLREAGLTGEAIPEDLRQPVQRKEKDAA